MSNIRKPSSKTDAAAKQNKKRSAGLRVAVVGATGLVGRNMTKVLEERELPVAELIPVASEKSIGKKIEFQGKKWSIVSPAAAVEMRPDIALFSAGSDVSKIWAPRFAAVKCYVIDNSAYWRMDPKKKLVIPEINGDVIRKGDYIIANPNCSTIQMLIAIAELHKKFKIKRIVVSTYQCITGTGKKAIDQMFAERAGQKSNAAYPYQIDMNLLPHIDKFLPTGYTKEEMKMVNETHKIMRDKNIRVSPTTVRVPVMGGHGESVNLEFAKSATIKEIFAVLKKTKGVVIQDNILPKKDGTQNSAIGAPLKEASKLTAKEIASLPYPMPLYTKDRDEVFVGRVRIDPTVKSGINFWCVSDNLRKGAATNAVQIAEVLTKKLL